MRSGHEIIEGGQLATAKERRVIQFMDLGIPDVVSLGRYAYHSARPGLDIHSHPDAVEICYLVRGSQTYRVGGREFLLFGGDLFVTAPGEPHDTGGQTEDCGVLYWLILRIPRKGGSLLQLATEDTALIVDKLAHLPERHFPGSPVVKQIFRQLFELYDMPAYEFKRVAVINQLHQCILEVLDCSNRHQTRQFSPAILRAVEKIRSSGDREISLLELAEDANLSLSRFKAKFKSETGIGPHEMILRTKVETAKTLLVHERATVTDIAMQLGFSSSQYFATVFRRFTRVTPAVFRAASGNCLPPLRDGNIQ